ncbi:hypothetical protein [Psychrobacter sp. 1U2]|uniref:hypothetical protein n=1 Tax=Psychrobacter sp. 1U2 TaxID=3453577 RepID=UPI003F6E434F
MKSTINKLIGSHLFTLLSTVDALSNFLSDFSYGFHKNCYTKYPNYFNNGRLLIKARPDCENRDKNGEIDAQNY